MTTFQILIAIPAFAVVLFLMFFGWKHALQDMGLIAAGEKKPVTPERKAEPEKETAKKEGEWSNEQIDRLINDFGLLMENGETPLPGSVKDSKFLPHAKSDFKRALLAGLFATDSKEIRYALLDGIMTLCQYQDGVGDQPIGGDALERFCASEKDIRKLAELTKLTLEEYENKWSELIVKEQIQISDVILAIAAERKLEKEIIEAVIVRKDLLQKGLLN